MTRYKVVLAGGGSTGLLSYLGVLHELHIRGVSIAAIAGTSAGGLAALIYAAPSRPHDYLDLLRWLTPGGPGGLSLSRRWWPLSWPPSLYKGAGIGRKAKRLLIPAMGDARIDVAVVVANLSRRRQEVWSSWETPSTPCHTAARATSAVPLLFEPVRYGADWYCDGGVTSNLATDDIIWPRAVADLPLILVRPSRDAQGVERSVGGLIGAVVDTALREGEREDEVGAHILIEVPAQTDSLALDLSASDAKRCYAQGEEAARAAFGWV